MGFSHLKTVGQYLEMYNQLLGLRLPCGNVFQSEGLLKHIAKRHPHCLQYIDQITEILDNPDYVGKNPAETDSVEFVKCYEDNILVAVKLDIRQNYLYVASLYDIKQSKLERRVNSGRLICLDKS